MTDDQRRTLAMLQPNFNVQRDLLVPRGKLPEQLLAEIEASEDGKFLVAGQRGMGKTTELIRLLELLKKDYFPVFVQFGAQESITYPMLIDAMAQALLRHPGLKISAKLSKLYHNWFTEEDELTTVEEGSEGSASIGGQLVVLAGKRSISHKKDKKRTKRTKILKSIQDLLQIFNELIAEAQKLSKRRVVIIVDDIDKIQDTSSIERTFIHTPHIIYSIRAPAIFTVPITYATSSSTRLGGLSYGGIYRVPAIEIIDQSGSPNDAEIDFVRQVLQLRMPYNPIPKAHLDQIIRYSGGVLIDAMRMARGVCKKSVLQQDFGIDNRAIEEEFQHLVDDYMFAFETNVLWRKLSKICTAINKNVIMTDEMLPELLYKMIVIEYRGEKLWFDLHPAVRRIFDQNRAVIENLE